jgi:hypothetical protein
MESADTWVKGIVAVIFTRVFVMVYIRPSAPVATSTAVKPATSTPPITGEHPLAGDSIPNEFVVTPQTDRRKSGSDRRQQRKGNLLETRSGRDRRKTNPSISISI